MALSEANRRLVERVCGPVWGEILFNDGTGQLNRLLDAGRQEARSELEGRVRELEEALHWAEQYVACQAPEDGSDRYAAETLITIRSALSQVVKP